jgi:hypothetical protein
MTTDQKSHTHKGYVILGILLGITAAWLGHIWAWNVHGSWFWWRTFFFPMGILILLSLVLVKLRPQIGATILVWSFFSWLLSAFIIPFVLLFLFPNLL